MRITSSWALALMAPALGFMMLVFAAPLASIFMASLGGPDGTAGGYYARLVTEPYYAGVLGYTIWIGLIVTVISAILAYPLAYYMSFAASRGVRLALYILLLIPFFTSNIVRSIAWLIILGRRGLVNTTLATMNLTDGPLQLLYNDIAVVTGLVYIMVPFVTMTLVASLDGVDRILLHAARDLGASALGSFFRVTLPLSLPGLLAGGLIAFALTVSAYVVPSVMSGGRRTVVAGLIYQQYTVTFDTGFGAAIAISLLLVTFVLIGLMLLALKCHSGPTAALP